MGFVADFSANNFQPKSTAASRPSKSARGYLADFGIKLPPEPKETFERSSQRPSPESQLRQAALRSGKSSLSSTGFASFANPQTSKKQAAKEQKQLQAKKLRSQLQKLNSQLDTVVKAGNVATMTEEKLRDEIGRAKDKLANRSDQLKEKNKEKEDTDKKLEKTRKLVSILDARIFGPNSRAHDWKWGLGADLMNDCFDIKLGFRLDEELDESQQHRLFNFFHEQKDKVWTLQDQASDKKDEVARIHAEVKVLEKGLAALKEQHAKTANTKEALGRKKESLQKQKEQLQDRFYRLTGTFYS